MMVCKHQSFNKHLYILTILNSLYNSLMNNLFIFKSDTHHHHQFYHLPLKDFINKLKKKIMWDIQGKKSSRDTNPFQPAQDNFSCMQVQLSIHPLACFLCFDAMLATPKWFFYLLWKWLTKLIQTLAFSNSTFCVVPFLNFILFH